VLPSRNFTVPVAAAGEVVAVSVTLVPAVGVVLEAISPVVVDAAWVVTETAEEVLAA
jgi:hypothetical protein